MIAVRSINRSIASSVRGWRALGAAAAMALVIAGCGGGYGAVSKSAPQKTTTAPSSSIPQHNGGDMDADNNGGPSDGDGNQ